MLALVLETIRGGDRLRWSLRRAREAGMEVVLLPVGHSPLGSAMVAAHSGAVAGGSGSWEALADDVAGHLVADLAELGDTLAVLSSTRRPRPGTGIATVHDSGAERSLVADLAHTLDVRFAALGPATLAALADRLDEGLVAENPLDVWGGGADTHRVFADCLATMAADPAVGVTALAVDLVPEHDGDTSYPDALLEVAAATTAPVVALTGLPAAVDVDAADRLRAAGIPVLEGFRSGLLALRHLLDVRRPARSRSPWSRRARWRPSRDPVRATTSWRRTASRRRRSAPHPPKPRPSRRPRRSAGRSSSRRPRRASRTAPTSAGWSRACTTPRPSRRRTPTSPRGWAPRSPCTDRSPAGVELSVGLVRDDALGPMVVVAAGGVLVELLSDRAVALPPLSRDGARRMVDRLRIRPLLDGFRGSPPADVEALVDVVVAVSHLAHERGDELAALDLNPVIVSPEGAVAVDVLVVPQT